MVVQLPKRQCLWSSLCSKIHKQHPILHSICSGIDWSRYMRKPVGSWMHVAAVVGDTTAVEFKPWSSSPVLRVWPDVPGVSPTWRGPQKPRLKMGWNMINDTYIYNMYIYIYIFGTIKWGVQYKECPAWTEKVELCKKTNTKKQRTTNP